MQETIRPIFMNYIPNTPADAAQELLAIGIKSVDELFLDIPKELRNKPIVGLPQPLNELELTRELKRMSQKNVTVEQKISFLGAGAYNHFIPAVVKHVTGRSEFYTAYTPYQAEMSQGMLQAIYEYQSMICALTGMDASNASLYDGATAVAEAAFLCCNSTGRNEVIVSESVNPAYTKVLKTYAKGSDIKIITAPINGGVTDIAQLKKLITEHTAGLILQHPNFFGCLEDVHSAEKLIHDAGGLFVVSADPISLGVLEAPGNYGADIYAAEGQSLGIHLSFGGPYLGLFAVKSKLLRLMPGRVVGKTTDHSGNAGFTLTLQTREQHIRREKATSNICSNEALCALAAAVYMSAMGKKGMQDVSKTCLEHAEYAKGLIAKLPGFSIAFAAPSYKEFVVKLPQSAQEVNKKLFQKDIIGGFDLSRYYPEMKNMMLFAFTEMNLKEDIEKLVAALQ